MLTEKKEKKKKVYAEHRTPANAAQTQTQTLNVRHWQECNRSMQWREKNESALINERKKIKQNKAKKKQKWFD